MTRRDPIVEEVRKHRAATARKYGYDIGVILEALEQEPDDTPTVSRAPKLAATRARKSSTRSIRRPNKRMEPTAWS